MCAQPCWCWFNQTCFIAIGLGFYMAGFNQSCFIGLGLGVYYIAGLNAGQGLNDQADPIKKKLINKTQELPLALNISICSNLINLAMEHTDCQWSWPNPQNESQSPSLYLKKWQAVLKPRRFLWMVWWRGPPAQSTQISCWSLTDWCVLSASLIGSSQLKYIQCFQISRWANLKSMKS